MQSVLALCQALHRSGDGHVLAILVEAPVIMLMSASTALVEDALTYRRLRNFSNALNAGSTALLLVVLVPPVYTFLMEGLIGLPGEVADLTQGALWILLPWPAAIGYRRFLHGLLIRSGRTRLVAIGTVLRLTGMSGTALLLFFLAELPGAWVGAAALSAGVVIEAIAARFMAMGTVREVKARETSLDGHPTEERSPARGRAACTGWAAPRPARPLARAAARGARGRSSAGSPRGRRTRRGRTARR